MYRLVIVVILLIMVLGSCEQPARTTLTGMEKKLLDSLYADRAQDVRKAADSLCDERYQEIFDAAVDSIKLVYVEEIKRIIDGDQ